MPIQTTIAQIGQSGIARALAPIVVPAREIFREPADLLGVQQANWAPVIADRIGSMIAPGWAAAQYANDVLKMILGAADYAGIKNAIDQVVALAPEILRRGINLASQIVGVVLSSTSIIGGMIALLFDWIVSLFQGGPSQEEWEEFLEVFIRLKNSISGFEVYAAESLKHHIAFQKIIEPGFRLGAPLPIEFALFERVDGKPALYPLNDDSNYRYQHYDFFNYQIMIPGLASPNGFVPLGYSMVFAGHVPGGRKNGIFLARSLKDLASRAIIYPLMGIEQYVVIPWWRKMWMNQARFMALKKVPDKYPDQNEPSLWEQLRGSVQIMSEWASDPMTDLETQVSENIIAQTRDAQQVVINGLNSALNNLGDAQAMFVHTPDENQVYRSRDGSAPYPGRKVVIVPRGSQRPPENLVALHWTSKGFDLYRGAAADNIIRGANRAAAQSARKTGDSRGGAALLALAAAGALIYANSRH